MLYYNFVYNVIVYYYSSYSLSLHCLGRTGVPCPPLRVLSGLSFLICSCCLIEGHVMAVWCGGREGVVWGGGLGVWCAWIWGFLVLT